MQTPLPRQLATSLDFPGRCLRVIIVLEVLSVFSFKIPSQSSMSGMQLMNLITNSYHNIATSSSIFHTVIVSIIN